MTLLLLIFFGFWRKPAPAEFAETVLPILQQRCVPCHFAGGKMYQRLPFDRPQTIVSLGEKKLFTRVKDAHDRQVIRAFLAAKR